jgi:CDP-2,3-bis-(O-geranylgeranyl)-sn-glycerol synthase
VRELREIMHAHEVLQVLWLFVPAYLANMSPVLVQRWFPRLATPIDGGRTFGGKRILGDHKTWRGLLAGVVVGTAAYELQRLLHGAGVATPLAVLDHPVLPGFLMGLGAGLGDAVKSFLKRRIDIAPGASWPVFDQLDFFAGAYLLLSALYVPPILPTLACLPIVLAGSIATTAMGWALGLKEAWI